MKKRDQDPLVSIITVVYNGEQYLEQTIKSVIEQTYKNIEYIIIDGGSNDGTVEIIKKYQSVLAYWISENDKGVYDAMNKGISLAKGEIIGIINSDDFYSLNAVECAVEHLYGYDRFEIFFGNMNRIYSHVKEKVIKISVPDSIFNNRLHIVHPTVFVKRKVYDLKKFDDTLKIAADLDFLVSVCNSNNIVKSDEVISNMRIGGLSSNFFGSITETYIVFRRRISRRLAIQHIFRILLKKIPVEFIRRIGLRS